MLLELLLDRGWGGGALSRPSRLPGWRTDGFPGQVASFSDFLTGGIAKHGLDVFRHPPGLGDQLLVQRTARQTE